MLILNCQCPSFPCYFQMLISVTASFLFLTTGSMAVQFVPLNSHLLHVLWISGSPDILICLTHVNIRYYLKKNSMWSLKYNQIYRYALLSENLFQISDKRLWCGNNQIWTNLLPVKGSTDGKICLTISSRCHLIICIWNLTVMCYMAWKKITKISF